MLSRISYLAVSGAALLASAAASQAALFTYDVQVTGGSSGVTVGNTKSVTVGAVGDVVHFAIYGVLSSGNASATDDGIIAAGGSIKSGTAGLLGNIVNTAVPSAFQGVGNSTGTQADLDGDTDLDVGSASTGSSTAYFIDRAPSPITPVAGNNLLLGTFDFAVSALSASGTTINFSPAILTTGLAATRNYHQFVIDGTQTNTNGADTSLVGAGTPVTISFVNSPEPTSLALLGVSGLGLLSRRRKTV